MIQSQADGLRAHYSNSPAQKDDRIWETKVDWQAFRILDRSLGKLITRRDEMIQNHLYHPSSALTNYSLYPRKQHSLAPKWSTPNQELKPLSLEFESLMQLICSPKQHRSLMINVFYFLFFHYFGVGTRWHLEHFNHRREDATFSVY